MPVPHLTPSFCAAHVMRFHDAVSHGCGARQASETARQVETCNVRKRHSIPGVFILKWTVIIRDFATGVGWPQTVLADMTAHFSEAQGSDGGLNAGNPPDEWGSDRVATLGSPACVRMEPNQSLTEPVSRWTSVSLNQRLTEPVSRTNRTVGGKIPKDTRRRIGSTRSALRDEIDVTRLEAGRSSPARTVGPAG